MAGRASVSKGKRGEHAAVRQLRVVWPEAERTGHRQRNARTRVPDVEGTPFWFEIKNQKRVNVREAFAQAELDAESDGRTPVVVYKEDGRREWMVAMALGELAWKTDLDKVPLKDCDMLVHVELRDWLAVMA